MTARYTHDPPEVQFTDDWLHFSEFLASQWWGILGTALRYSKAWKLLQQRSEMSIKESLWAEKKKALTNVVTTQVYFIPGIMQIHFQCLVTGLEDLSMGFFFTSGFTNKERLSVTPCNINLHSALIRYLSDFGPRMMLKRTQPNPLFPCRQRENLGGLEAKVSSAGYSK